MKHHSSSKEVKKVEIVLDASNWKNKDDFYSSYCKITKAPKWFGNNLDALNDSLSGGICKITAEKIIVKNITSKIKESLGSDFWSTFEEICQEQDVELEVCND
jgi:RNAse (barnase) inhibitor barstar